MGCCVAGKAQNPSAKQNESEIQLNDVSIHREPKPKKESDKGSPALPQFENKYSDYPKSKKELLMAFSNWKPTHVWDFRSIYKVFIDNTLSPGGEQCFVYSVEKKLATQTEIQNDQNAQNHRPSSAMEDKYVHFMYFAHKIGNSSMKSLSNYISTCFYEKYTYADAVQIIKAVCQAIEESKEESLSFNLENILVLEEQPLRLKLFSMVEIDKHLLEDNKFLKRRWNAQIEESEVDRRELIVQHQNKLNLAILAFWLESDGHLPLKVYENAKSIITDRAFRQKYIEELGDNVLLYKFIIQNFESSMNQIRQTIDLKLKSGGRESNALQTGFIQSKFIKNQATLLLSDELLSSYKQKDEAEQQRLKLNLMKFTRGQALKSMESFHEFIEFLERNISFDNEQLKNYMGNYKFQTDYMRDFKNKAIILQMIGLLEHYDRFFMRKEYISQVF